MAEIRHQAPKLHVVVRQNAGGEGWVWEWVGSSIPSSPPPCDSVSHGSKGLPCAWYLHLGQKFHPTKPPCTRHFTVLILAGLWGSVCRVSVINNVYQSRNGAVPLTVKLRWGFILKRDDLETSVLCTNQSDGVSPLAARKGQALALGC